MTESEAKGFIQGKLDCMKKCGIFNKEDNVSDKDCDNCDYCYSQGNFGEQKNAFEMAIKALEEVQQYRAIESELREQYHANVDIKMVMHYFIETIFKGIKHDRFCVLTNEDADKWEAYKAIGTPEECQTAVEKMKPKKTAIEAINVTNRL